MKISTRLSADFGLLILLFNLCAGIAVHTLRQVWDVIQVKAA